MEASMQPIPRPAEAAPGMDFEAWAALSARMLKADAETRFDVLEECGVSPDEWSESDMRYLALLAEDVEAGRLDRAQVYGRLCAAEMERRLQRSQKDESERPRVPPSDAVPMLADAPAIGVAEAVPSYLLSLPAAPAEGAQKSPLAGTAMALELPSFVRQAAGRLPFGTTPSPEFLAAASAPKPTESSSLGATAPLGDDMFAAVRATLPFVGASGPARKPALSLEAYASLCAQLAVSPGSSAEILPRYGVHTDEMKRAVDAEWQARMSSHPATRAEWQRLCAVYESWLRNGGR